MTRLRSWLKAQVQVLWDIKEHPHSVSLGFAIGMFLGFSPLFGVKTLLALGVAWAARSSKVAAVVAVTLHDLFLPLLPVLLRFEYQIGYWLLSDPHHLPRRIKIAHLNFQSMLSWTTFVTVGKPLLLGSIVVGVPVAVASYFIVRAAIVRGLPKAPLPEPESP